MCCSCRIITYVLLCGGYTPFQGRWHEGSDTADDGARVNFHDSTGVTGPRKNISDEGTPGTNRGSGNALI